MIVCPPIKQNLRQHTGTRADLQHVAVLYLNNSGDTPHGMLIDQEVLVLWCSHFDVKTWYFTFGSWSSSRIRFATIFSG